MPKTFYGSVFSIQRIGQIGMQDVFFYIFAALTLGCGALVVANPVSRNPVTSAMFLVLTIISLAGLFVLLHAFFLAAVQVLVYAGAVIVLFLFVIMLLDLKEEEQRRIKYFTAGLAVVAAGTLAGRDGAHDQAGAFGGRAGAGGARGGFGRRAGPPALHRIRAAL